LKFSWDRDFDESLAFLDNAIFSEMKRRRQNESKTNEVNKHELIKQNKHELKQASIKRYKQNNQSINQSIKQQKQHKQP